MFITKSKAKSACGIAIMAVGTAIALQMPTHAQKVAKFSQLLVEASDLLNQQLPMNINSTVRWDSTSAGPGRLMTYDYTLTTLSASQVDGKVFAQQFYPFVKNMLCNEPSAKIFRDHDVSLSVNVFDNQRSLVSRVKVSPSECSALHVKVRRF